MANPNPNPTSAAPTASTSIQFDESTLASPSRDNRRGARTPSSSINGNGSAAGAASPPSRTVGLPARYGSPTPASQPAAHHHRTRSGTPSTSASVQGQSAVGSQRQRNTGRRKVVTTPAWARSEDDEDYQTSSPDAAPSTSYPTATTRSAPLPSSPPLKPISSSQKSAAQREEEAAASTGGLYTLPPQDPAVGSSSSAASPGANPNGEEEEDHLKGPARFWTFSLPTKYRNRLHEHHLRQLERELIEKSKRHGRPRPSRPSDASSRDGDDGDGGSSDGGHDFELDGSGGQGSKRRRRSSAGGLGDAHASAGAAAGMVGADSLVSWRRRQQGGAGTAPASPRVETSPDDSSGGIGGARPRGDAEHAYDEGSGDHDHEHDGYSGGADEEKALSRRRPARRDDSPAYSGDDVELGERSKHALPATSMRVPMPPSPRGSESFDITRHQAQTPGWESPWRPESMHGHGTINIGGYTFASGGDAFFPRTDTRRSGASGGGGKRRRRGRRSGRTNGAADAEKSSPGGGGRDETWLRARWEWWKVFLMRNPFVPLLFRIINLSFTTATLAVAIRLWRVLHTEGAANSVGSSPLVGIVFAPLSLVHVGTQVWLDYFSRPIGLWAVKSKLSYQLVELVFIALWSALLSLTFDNLATSSLGCVYWYDAYPTCGTTGSPELTQLRDPAKKPTICALQKAFIGLTFVTLVAYVTVFIISIYRTVNR